MSSKSLIFHNHRGRMKKGQFLPHTEFLFEVINVAMENMAKPYSIGYCIKEHVKSWSQAGICPYIPVNFHHREKFEEWKRRKENGL